MDEQEKFHRLAQILSEDNVKGLEFISIDDFGGIRGLSSLLSRQPGEELFRIPFKYLFTDYKIECHPKLSAIWSKHPRILAAYQQQSNSPDSVYPFILLFYYELIHASSEFRRLWFSLFPRNLNGHSIAWSDQELKGCGNLCPLRRDTIQIQVWIKKTFKLLQPIVCEFEDGIFGAEGVAQFNESMVEFLCMTCRNRGVLLPIDSGSGSGDVDQKTMEPQDQQQQRLYHCFVPLGDFGNHKFGAKSSLQLEHANKRRHLEEMVNLFVRSHPELMKKKFFEFDAGDQTVVVRAQEHILSGAQICYEYTAAPNWELVQNFGFAVPFNPCDRVLVNLTFDDEDPKRLSTELQLLNRMGVASFIKRVSDGQRTKYSLSIALTLSDACPTVLLAANRIKLLSDAQLKQMSAQQIVFMDRLIMRAQKGNDKEDVEMSTEDVNKLKVLELNVLRSLQASLDVLYEGYQHESIIEESECKHPEVQIVYQSIRMILRKSTQILGEKVKDLSG